MLYSNKIKPYKFVNPNLIYVPRSGMASAVKGEDGDRKSLTGISLSSKRTLLGLNRLGASLYSLGETQRQIRDAVGKQVSIVKDKQKFNLKRKQYLRDQESERQTELAGEVDAKDAIDDKEVKKEGEKKLSWLEKLLGPFKGIIEFALRAIITQGILKWVSDPKNGERLGKVIKGLSAFFGFVFGIVSWSIGTFLSGVSNLFGDGSKGGFSRFAEVLGGLGQILVGLAGLKAAMYLLNPFSLISDILGLIDVISSKGPPGGGDVPQGGGSGTTKPQLNKAAQKVAENYGDDAAKLYADSISRGRSPAAALGDVKKKFTKLPPKPTGLLGKMRQGVMDQVGKVRSGVSDTISGVKQFGAKAFDVGKQVFDKGKDLVKGTGSWIKTQAGNVKNLASIAKDPAALGEFVKNIVSNKLKPTLEKNELVKRLLDLVKDPKNIGKNIGPLIKDALKSKEVLKLRDYLQQVQGKAKIGGLDTVIAALMGLLDYGVFGTPFANAFLGALGGLLGYAGGFALGAPFGGFPGFIAGAAGGIAGEHIGRSLARLLGKGPLGEIEDPLMRDAAINPGRKLADPALAEGGLITKPTRALIGERGPEIVIPLAMLGGAGGIGPIASMLSSALTGALSAMGSSGELAKQVIGEELSLLKKEGGPSSPANPGETLGKSVIKSSSNLDLLQLGDNSEEVNSYVGDRSSYRKGSDRNTLRGALANILAVFESITKKSFRTGGGSGGTSGGGTGDDGGPVDASGIEAATGSVVDKGVSIAKKFMSNLGLTKESAAAIAGNFAHESAGFIPGIREGGPFGSNSKPWPKGTVGKGYGWAQWTNSVPGDRYDKFIESYGGDYNKVPTNEDNFKFAVKEMKTTNKLSDAFKKMTDVAAATVWFRKNWERAGVHHDEPRIKYAKGVLAKLAKGGKIPMNSPEYNEKWSGDGRDEILKKFSAGGKSIIEGAKKIIGAGRGVKDRCADTTRQALKAAGHSAASKRTQKGDLDTPKGTAFNGANYAASFGGSDMGTVIKDKSQIKMGDIILWKADKDLGGSSKKGAITHVGIAADDGLKHQYDHNVARGWHYRPHWNSAGGTSWLAGIRLGGSGTIGTDDSTSSPTTGDTGTEDKEMTPEEQLNSIISKMASNILKLGAESSEKKAETSVATTTPTIKAVPDSNDGSKVPPAPKNVSISAPAPSSQNNLDKLSSIAVELDEDTNQRTALVPVPMVINSSSASSSSPQQRVVRARQPITYGF
jgi:hypothetical protein